MNKILLFYLIIFFLPIIPAFTFAQEFNPTKKEATIARDSLSTISGTLVCISEELAKIRKIEPECEKYGCIFGLKTSDNIIWSFYRNPLGIKLQEETQNKGKKIRIWGKLIHNAKVIEVHDFNILNK